MKHKQQPLPPPPPPSELAFQQYHFDDRLVGEPKFVLGAAFFGKYGRDMTIRGGLIQRLRDAGNVLRGSNE